MRLQSLYNNAMLHAATKGISGVTIYSFASPFIPLSSADPWKMQIKIRYMTVRILYIHALSRVHTYLTLHRVDGSTSIQINLQACLPVLSCCSLHTKMGADHMHTFSFFCILNHYPSIRLVRTPIAQLFMQAWFTVWWLDTVGNVLTLFYAAHWSLWISLY